jgi:hypothetical protein
VLLVPTGAGSSWARPHFPVSNRTLSAELCYHPPVDFSRMAQLAVGRLTVRSALNPLLWLVAIIAVPCVLTAAIAADPIMKWAVFSLGAVVVLVVLGIGLMFAIRCPDKLQSEDYQLRQQSLQMLQGAAGTEVIDAEAVVAIANPGVTARALPAATGGDQP